MNQRNLNDLTDSFQGNHESCSRNLQELIELLKSNEKD